MSLATVADSAPRARRRSVAKATRPQGDQRVKVSVYLSPENAKRLGVHSTMESTTQSDLVNRLITENLKRWVVQDRSGSAKPTDCGTQVESTDTTTQP